MEKTRELNGCSTMEKNGKKMEPNLSNKQTTNNQTLIQYCFFTLSLLHTEEFSVWQSPAVSMESLMQRHNMWRDFLQWDFLPSSRANRGTGVADPSTYSSNLLTHFTGCCVGGGPASHSPESSWPIKILVMQFVSQSLWWNCTTTQNLKGTANIRFGVLMMENWVSTITRP